VARDKIELPTRGFSGLVDTADYVSQSVNISGILMIKPISLLSIFPFAAD
jgi:hypothetical protein